jgi:hypothetical protein
MARRIEEKEELFMRLANAFAAALVLLAGVAGTAAAQDSEEGGTFYSHIYVDMGTGMQYTPKGFVTQLAGDVYNNTNPQATALAGFSSTDLNAQYGDRLTTTGTGILQENDFTIFNSPSSAGPLLSSTFNIALFNGTTSALLGNYSTGAVTFGAGLAPGFFSVITITGLSGLNINVNTTDVIMRQQCGTRTGTANRLGVVLLDPPTIGSSTNTMYINATTVGAAGFYNIGNPALNANPGYRVNVAQPVPAGTRSWGAIKAMYHL